MGRETKDEKLIAALLTYPTVREAAQAVGRSESQVYLRTKQPDFVEKYDAARRELLSKATAELQAHLSEAVRVMIDVMNDSEASPQVRLNAADAMLRNCAKYTEVEDILRRLDRLERGE